MALRFLRISSGPLFFSIEEAKKRIYACSTSTYEGFQAIMTEEESEKFKDVPGVVWVLPDSYIDPVNKEYGGDKYENGVITHRPAPVQFGRARGRPRDQSRNYDRQRYDQQGSTAPNWRGNPSSSQRGSMQGDGIHGANYVPPQSNRQQSFGAQQPSNRDYAPGGRGSRSGPKMYQGNYSQTGQKNYNHHEQRQFQQWDQRNHAPLGQSNSKIHEQGAMPLYGQVLGPDHGQGSGLGANSDNQQRNPGHGDGQKFS